MLSFPYLLEKDRFESSPCSNSTLSRHRYWKDIKLRKPTPHIVVLIFSQIFEVVSFEVQAAEGAPTNGKFLNNLLRKC